MQHELEKTERFADRVPPLRTIQNIARAATVVDDSEPWRLGDGLGLSAGLVLDVLSEVIERSGGRRRHLTREEAKWIVRIRRARPEIDPWLAYILAREFMAPSSTHIDVDTAFLAFAPWRQKRKGPTKRWEKAEESFGLGYTRWGWWIK